MTARMWCAHCGAPMDRQPLGYWRPTCGCTVRGYWTDALPLSTDVWMQPTIRHLPPHLSQRESYAAVLCVGAPGWNNGKPAARPR